MTTRTPALIAPSAERAAQRGAERAERRARFAGALGVLAACWMASCCPAAAAGPPPASAQTVVVSNAGGGAPYPIPSQLVCPPDQALLGGRCFSMAGTAWQLTTHMPDGTRVFLVEFHPGGVTRSHDPVDTTPSNDSWEQQGTTFRFWFNDRYVVHETQLGDEQQMSGTTLNVQGVRWGWSAVRAR